MTTLTMTRGDDRVLSAQATEDLTGSDLTFTARLHWYDVEAVITKTSGDGITLDVDPTIALVSIAAADTEELDPVALSWDIQVVDAADKTHTVAKGRLAVTHDITRGS